ncbi:MAG: sugar transferase [Chloroflexota bacterium]|nr:sugar transferase [Chloroflexota bacterium]
MHDSKARRAHLRREHREYTLIMPLIDALLAVLAFALAYIVRYEWQLLRPVFELNRAPFEPFLPYVAVYVAWLYLTYRGSGLYRPAHGRAWLEEVYTLINGVTNATVVLMAISFVTQPVVFSRLMLIYAALITIILLAAARVVQRMVQTRLRARGVGVQRALVVGVGVAESGSVGGAVLRTLISRRELGYEPIGFLDADPERGGVDIGRVRGLGGIDNLAKSLRECPIDIVLITLPWTQHARIVEMIQMCRVAGVEVSVVPDVFQLNLRQVQVENLDGIPLLRVNGHVSFKGTNRLLKRAIDLGLITLFAPVWIPLFVLVALLIRLESSGAVFYRAKRVGENGREFGMIKFRSMIPDAEKLRDHLTKTLELDPRRPKIKNDPRVTRVGRFIRATSLDELPNLINVLRGHMSLVGPRPPTPDEVSLYEPWHMQRLQILPGMTGLWQVSGRSEVPFEEMCLMDIYYIENWSIGLDAQILMMTIPHVLLRQGAY